MLKKHTKILKIKMHNVSCEGYRFRCRAIENSVLRCMVCKTHQCSADYIPEEFQTSTGFNINTSFMEWVSMAEQLHASLTSAMQSVGYSGVKHIATGIWSTGNLLCGVTNHASLFGNQIGESGEIQRNNGMGLSFRGLARPLIFSEGKS